MDKLLKNATCRSNNAILKNLLSISYPQSHKLTIRPLRPPRAQGRDNHFHPLVFVRNNHSMTPKVAKFNKILLTFYFKK